MFNVLNNHYRISPDVYIPADVLSCGSNMLLTEMLIVPKEELHLSNCTGDLERSSC